MQPDLVLYQVCVDREGEFPFDGTGTQFDDKATAIEHLAETRLTRPYAYLAQVTFQRCVDHTLSASRDVSGMSPADWILSFTEHGLDATRTLQALCHLLGKLQPSEDDDEANITTLYDFARAVSGMTVQLQIIDDCFDNIQVRAMPHDEHAATPWLPGGDGPPPDSQPDAPTAFKSRHRHPFVAIVPNPGRTPA